MDRLDLTFLGSFMDVQQMPASSKELGIVGRSNSGKSSVINALARSKKAARTGRTPGRTQSLNMFEVRGIEGGSLLDMPGYGFAAVNKRAQATWSRMIGDYLEQRQPLVGVMVIIDVRRGLMAQDIDMITLCHGCQCACVLVVNKIDQMPYGKRMAQLKVIEDQRKLLPGIDAMYPVSCLKYIGIDALRDAVIEKIS